MKLELRHVIWVLLVVLVVGLSGSYLFAQAVAAAAEGTPLEAAPTNEWGTSAVLAYFISRFMQKWKTSGVPGFSDQQTRFVKGVVSWLMAAASAIGVHATFDASAGTLLITGLTTAGIAESAIEVARSYVFQQVAYHAVVEKMEE